MKRFFSLLLSLLSVLLLLPACNMSDPLENETDYMDTELIEEEQETVISSFSLPVYRGATLDPILCSDGVQLTLSRLLYEGLFTLSPTYEVENRLCREYSYSKEQYCYTYTLRDDVCFGDGSELTAKDVVASLRRAEVSERYKARFRNVKSFFAKGTDTVVVYLNCDNAAFNALMDIPIVKSGTETQTVPLGTGPYLYITEGEEEYLLANESWWGGECSIDKIFLVQVKDENAANYRFYGGDVQLLATELTKKNPVSTAGQVSITDAPGTTLQYFGFRESGLFGNSKLRQAVSLGLRRSEMTAGYLSGHAMAAVFPLSPASVLYPDELASEFLSGSFASAMEALGYSVTSEIQHTVRLIVPEDNEYKVNIANMLAALLQPYGIQVNTEALPWDSYLQALQNGNYDIYYATARLTADWNLQPLIGSFGSLNYGYYSSAEMDALLSAYLASPSASSMKALCRLFAEEMPIVPLFFQSVSVLTQEQVVLSSITPSASDPFYGMNAWELHLSE